MKLIFQITLGVFIGTLASQFTFHGWRIHQEAIAKEAVDKLQAEQDKVRFEKGERIRAMIMQGRDTESSPAGFVPDDAQVKMPDTK